MVEKMEKLARLAADTADDKKARDVVILDLRGLSVIADYFVICSANSRTQVQAVADAVEEKLTLGGLVCKGMEGRDEARWVLIDFGDIVVHVFQDEERSFYGLERLWGDAPRVSIEV